MNVPKPACGDKSGGDGGGSALGVVGSGYCGQVFSSQQLTPTGLRSINKRPSAKHCRCTEWPVTPTPQWQPLSRIKECDPKKWCFPLPPQGHARQLGDPLARGDALVLRGNFPSSIWEFFQTYISAEFLVDINSGQESQVGAGGVCVCSNTGAQRTILSLKLRSGSCQLCSSAI